PIGIASIVIGVILFVIAILGFVGICCHVKAVLIVVSLVGVICWIEFTCVDALVMEARKKFKLTIDVTGMNKCLYACIVGLIALAHFILIIIHFSDEDRCLRRISRNIHYLVKGYKSIESGEIFSVTFGMIMTMAQSPGFHQTYVLLEPKLDYFREIHSFANQFDFAIDSPGTQATEYASPDRLPFQLLRYSRYRDKCAFLIVQHIQLTGNITDKRFGSVSAIQFPAPCCKKGYVGEGAQNCPQMFTELNSNYLRGCNEVLYYSLKKPITITALASLVIPIV
ncbi:hypothetical protein T265_14918, partial [Opisthorchis viverrini]